MGHGFRSNGTPTSSAEDYGCPFWSSSWSQLLPFWEYITWRKSCTRITPRTIMNFPQRRSACCLSWAPWVAKVKNLNPSGPVAFINFSCLLSGCEKVPSSWPFRLIVLSHLITGLLLSGGFSSTLTSYLAIRGSSVPLASLEDALQKRSHSVCVRNDSSAYIHFTVVTNFLICRY